jgi:hypothetical protein
MACVPYFRLADNTVHIPYFPHCEGRGPAWGRGLRGRFYSLDAKEAQKKRKKRAHFVHIFFMF